MRSARLAVILDCCCVLVFVIIGRADHTRGESLAGIASTAWPFLAGLAGGWLAARGVVDLGSVVTNRFGLGEVREAFADGARRTGLKVVVEPQR